MVLASATVSPRTGAFPIFAENAQYRSCRPTSDFRKLQPAMSLTSSGEEQVVDLNQEIAVLVGQSARASCGCCAR
jgi:hypothetical protein